MSAGVAHVRTGVALSTLMLTVFVAVVKFAASVGVNVTDSVCPAPAFSAVPNVMSAGVAHVMMGVAFRTLMLTVFVAVVKFAVSVGVKVTDRILFAPAVR